MRQTSNTLRAEAMPATPEAASFLSEPKLDLTLSAYAIHPLWGKAGHGSAEQHTALPVHLMAVSACFGELVREPTAQRTLCHAWGVDIATFNARVLPWLVFIAALHDLGKALPGFQRKRQDVVAWIQAGGTSSTAPLPADETGFDHSVRGGLLLMTLVFRALANSDQRPDLAVPLVQDASSRRTIEGLMKAAFAHHGHHPNGQSTAEASANPLRRSEWGAVQPKIMPTVVHLVDVVRDVFGGLDGAPLPPPRHPVACAHLFAGAVALSDWIGSNEGLFPFIDCLTFGRDFQNSHQWSTLFRHQQTVARDHLVKIGQLDVLTRSDVGLASQNPRHDLSALESAVMGAHAMRPVQKAAQEAARACASNARIVKSAPDPRHGVPPACGLLIVEAPMGVGKTEAALLAAGEFMSAGLCSGIAFGLPAQASANMVFKRLTPLARRVFRIQEPNLAHGQASFARERLTLTGEETGQESVAHLDEWITDDNKKAFLAPLCAATVDQMELSAMHSKHGFIRFASLSKQAVIIDEVHAYDAYMQRILQTLLRLLASAGTPVILLSATLPDAIRRSLLEAYADGAGWALGEFDVPVDAYPLVIALSPPQQVQLDLPVVPSLTIPPWCGPQRKVYFRMILNDRVAQRVVELAHGGQCVAVLCNTVKSAKQRLVDLQAIDPDLNVTLLHSRLRIADRIRIQERIEAFAGVTSTLDDRRGRVIVATQVLEQFIDIDVDAMFTEPAPIDLMLHRMGRQHRHERAHRTCDAEFHVIEPNVLGEARPIGRVSGEACWFDSTLRIFGESGKLLPSLALVRRLAQSGDPISLPKDIPRLVHGIYGDANEHTMTAKQLQADLAAKHVVLDDRGSIDRFAQSAIRCSQTRNTDDGASGLRVLFVHEEPDGMSLWIPTPEGSIELPGVHVCEGRPTLKPATSAVSDVQCEQNERSETGPSLDVHSGSRVSKEFLKAAQPWIITIDTWSDEFKVFRQSARVRLDLKTDWRSGKPIDEGETDLPPFAIVKVGRVRQEVGEVVFNLGPDLIYHSSEGIRSLFEKTVGSS